MNDLHFVKYKPNVMMLDTLGLSAAAKVAHRQLFDMTIILDGPPPDDAKKLIELTSCTAKKWNAVKAELMTKGWHVKGGYFLHNGIIATLNESKQEYVTQYNRTAAANNKPRLELSAPDAVTGCVTYRVTPAVTQGVKPPMTPTHLQLQPHLKDKSLIGSRRKASYNGRLTPAQLNTASRFEKALGAGWENDHLKWMKRCRHEHKKADRVIAEVESAIKESRIKTTPAAYAEQIWKEFK